MGYDSLKNIILKLTPKKVIKLYQNAALSEERIEYSNMSFAQEGEDIILDRFLKYKKDGFYIDVGAHHPKRFSNTYNFYKKGWRGLNIDAMPGSMEVFNAERPEDINLEIGISKVEKELTYYMFNEPALNTFSEIEAKKKDSLGVYKITEQRTVFTYPLKTILNKHIGHQAIDFMTIDVEGLDLEVIESNDWELYRPKLVLVEDLNKMPLIELPHHSELYKIMIANDYDLVAKTFNTLFFKDKRN